MKKVEFFALSKPYQDFAVIRSRNDLRTATFSECAGAGFWVEMRPLPDQSHGCLLTRSGAKALEEGSILFSGLAKLGERLIYGEDDLQTAADVKNTEDAIGTFTLCHLMPSRIVFRTDYFALGRFYYYESPDLFVIANRYHLLLLILRDLNVPLEMDEDLMLSTLCTVPGCTPLLAQHFTKKMLIKNCFRLPADQCVEISAAGVRFIQNTLGADLRAKNPFSPEEYPVLIQKAASELIENVKVVLEDERFQHIVVDLTSGLDSRLTFAALTNLEKGKDKISIKTGGKEEEYALLVNSLYQFPYQTIGPDSVEQLDLDAAINVHRSYHIGNEELLWNIYCEKQTYSHTINLTGTCGELYRPYYSFTYRAAANSAESDLVTRSVDNLISSRKEKFILDYQKTSPLLANALREELDALPGNSWEEKISNHYLFHRNSYFFNYECMSELVIVRWHVLMSKTMFRIQQNSRTMTPIFDLLNALNPLLLHIPYNHPEYETYLRGHQKDLLSVPSFARGFVPPVHADRTSWENACKQKSAESAKAERMNVQNPASLKRVQESFYPQSLKMLKKLAFWQEGRLRNEADALSQWLEGQKDHPLSVKYLWSRLSSVMDQAELSVPHCEKNPKLRIALTIDVEDKYETEPNMIECDFGKAGNCGVRYIMNQLEKRNMRGVFFVNIYEHDKFHGPYEGYMEKLIREIHERGHEVGLHTHALGSTLSYYKKELAFCSYEEQKNILQYGVNFIEHNTGVKPLSHRGGGYSCNEDTFRILSDLGFQVDSSCYYNNKGAGGNRFACYPSLNQPCLIGDLREYPLVSIRRPTMLTDKFDINGLSEGELKEAVAQMKARPEFHFATFLLHSFSMTDQHGGEKKRAVFSVPKHSFYGVSDKLTLRFENFLDSLSSDPDIEVVTYRQIAEETFEPSFWGDGMFDLMNPKIDAYIPCTRRNPRTFLTRSWKNRLSHDQSSLMDFITPPLHQRHFNVSTEEAKRIANQVMELRLNPDFAPFHAPSDQNWSLCFENFETHSQILAPVQIMTSAFEETGNTAFLRWVGSYLKRWYQYRNQNAGKQEDFLEIVSQVENILDYGRVCTMAGFWDREFLNMLFRMLRDTAEQLLRCLTDNPTDEKRKNLALLASGAVLCEEYFYQPARILLGNMESDDAQIHKILKDFDSFLSNPLKETCWEISLDDVVRSVKTKLNGNTLTVACELREGLRLEYQFALYLYLNNTVVQKSRYQREPLFAFEGVLPGLYDIEYYISYGNIQYIRKIQNVEVCEICDGQ